MITGCCSFRAESRGTATDSLNRGLFQAQQHIAASEGSVARDFSQGIKKKRGERGRRERERERNVLTVLTVPSNMLR